MSPILTQPPRRKSKAKKVRKILLWLAMLGLLLVVVGLFAVPPMIMGEMVNMHVDFRTIHSAEDYGISAEKITLTTQDGLKVVAYEVASVDPRAMVIFLSGIHNPSVTAFFGHARMLQEHGYGAILLEMRAHGESEGATISLGYKEYLDTQAVVDHLTQNYPDTPIIVYGLSMGAATAINSIGQIDEIDGLISLSAYSAWEDVFYDNMINMGAPKMYATIQKPFVQIYSLYKYGFKSLGLSPKKQIQKIGVKPALLIHSTEDSQIPYSSFERLKQIAPEHVETWTRAGDLHFIVKSDEQFLRPQTDQEYTERIMSFLNTHFKDSGR